MILSSAGKSRIASSLFLELAEEYQESVNRAICYGEVKATLLCNDFLPPEFARFMDAVGWNGGIKEYVTNVWLDECSLELRIPQDLTTVKIFVWSGCRWVQCDSISHACWMAKFKKFKPLTEAELKALPF